jgi:glycosyltransferase involved in cell wall biosynthesis/2-polyprenyl-3-methyl-5-hydroxy-6-metoxy-1,4-benzoquinol methylase
MQKFGGLETKNIDSCPVCHDRSNDVLLTRADGVTLIKCKTCATLHVNEYPIEPSQIYKRQYFELSNCQQGIGYQTGYTPIHEQMWQVGLTLIAADILDMPHDNILDIGCATGQFLSLCRAFGAKDLHGIELSEEAVEAAHHSGFVVDNCEVEQYYSDQKNQISTAWDVVEHLPNPQLLASKITSCLNEKGIFCFSTPNGDIPGAMATPEKWEGFQHSFEHIFYLTTSGTTKIFGGNFSGIFLYPVQIYGGDLLLGILSKSSIDRRQRELLNCLFDNPGELILAAESGELSAHGISGLICLYMMFGKISDAEVLIKILASNPGIPLGTLALLQGSILARLGRVKEAQERYQIAINVLSTREIALSSCTALMQIYQQQQEIHTTTLQAKINDLTTSICAHKQIESQMDLLISQNHTLTAEIDVLMKKIQVDTENFQDYKSDKELYIAALKTQSEIIAKIRSKLKLKLKNILIKVLPGNIRQFWQDLSYESLNSNLNSQTTVYALDNTLLPGYHQRVNLKKTHELKSSISVTLITTVLNEEESINQWLESIDRQIHKPDELIIVDAGSTDRTQSIIKEFLTSASFKIHLVVNSGVTIAQGRNLAIEMATHPIIACTDLGCYADPHWLERLIAPFGIDPTTEVSAGWTKANATNSFQKSLAFLSTPSNYSQIDPSRYIPSSRTIAFTKSAWYQVGGYPEWATFAGEDSFFGLMLKSQCKNWAFVPEAIVYWDMRKTWRAVYKQAYLYGFGDGELAIYSHNYLRDIKYLTILVLPILVALPISILVSLFFPLVGKIIGGISLTLLIFGAKKVTSKFIQSIQAPDNPPQVLTTLMLGVILIARVNGFINGTLNRPFTLQRRFSNTVGTVIIFSGVPIDDSGGGQRATQLALEFLDRRYRVIFLNQYPSYESLDLNLSIRHPNLETKSVELFDPTLFIKSHCQEKILIAIAEFPHPNFIAPMKLLQSQGAKTVYDLIDDWRSSLGGDWYTEETEQKFINFCNLLVASAQDLQVRLAAKSGKEVFLVPNAVNQRIFKRSPYLIPEDMIKGSPTLMYIGALWGDWFDWDLLILTAKSYPTAKVVVIGDYHGQCPENLPNLHFLGLKPQSELPKYLAYADVTLIPFKISELTQAVNPLKVFEYLAMGIPVVSTSLNEVSKMPYVYIGKSHQEFIEQVAIAVSTPVDIQRIDTFIALNTWNQRVNSILNNIQN